jgi:hypothetical protein
MRFIYLTLVFALLVGVGGIFYLWAELRPPSRDPVTGCLANGALPAHAVVLIDQSDPFSPTDLDWVTDEMRRTASTLPRYGKLSVLGLTESARLFAGHSRIKPLAGVVDRADSSAATFGLCSPGTSDQLSQFERLSRNLSQVDREFK